MCLRMLENGGLELHVSEGQRVGRNLHSRSSWSSMLGSRYGQPEVLKRHRSTKELSDQPFVEVSSGKKEWHQVLSHNHKAYFKCYLSLVPE